MPKQKPEIPAPLQKFVATIGDPVAAKDVDTFGKLQSIHDQSHRTRTIVKAWKAQQDQERSMRERYATTLIRSLIAQAFAINVIFVLIGCGVLKYEPWTARAFIMAVFAELAAMVFFIVKYLFRPTGDTVLELTQQRPLVATKKRGRRVN